MSLHPYLLQGKYEIMNFLTWGTSDYVRIVTILLIMESRRKFSHLYVFRNGSTAFKDNHFRLELVKNFTNVESFHFSTFQTNIST